MCNQHGGSKDDWFTKTEKGIWSWSWSWSPEKDCCWGPTFQQPVEKPSSESSDSKDGVCTGCRNVRITTNNPSQGSNHPDDHNFQAMYVTPGFKPFSYLDFGYKMKINALKIGKNWPGCFIKDQNCWIFQQCSRDCNSVKRK